MKRKLLAGISLTLFLTMALFFVFPAKSQWDGTIKIGAIGPMPWIQGQGIREGAILAAEEINAMGGVQVKYDASTGDWVAYGSTQSYKIEIVAADTLRGLPDPTTASGTAAALELVAAGVDFAFGGFRTEATFGIREVMADNEILYTITGAATNQLVDEPNVGAYPNTVRTNYDRYKYIFRSTPMNSTMLFYGVAFFLRWAMVNKMAPLYAGPVGSTVKPLPIAVISEALTWADVIHANLASSHFWNMEVYMNMSKILRGVTYAYTPATAGVWVVAAPRVSPVATDISAELTTIMTSGARLVIPILSGPVGRTFIKQWKSMDVNAVPMGIDVPGQEYPLHWTATAGDCEYEILTATSPNTPTAPRAVEANAAYMARWGHSPIYTSYGAWDSVYGFWERVDCRDLGGLGLVTGKTPGVGGTGAWPMDNEQQVVYNELTYRPHGVGRTFQFTGPNPGIADYAATWSNSTHDPTDINPTMRGTLHELYHSGAELIQLWVPPYYGRMQWGQWLAGDIQVIYPINQIYSAKLRIPPRLYDLAEPDLVVDGVIDGTDILVITAAWQTVATSWFPTSPGWNPEADVDGNNVINVLDLSSVAASFGDTVKLEWQP